MTEENNLVQNPKILGVVEIPKIDLRPFNGLKSVIAEVKYCNHATNGRYVKVVSAVLEGSPEGKPIKAYKILSLFEVKNEETGEVEGYGWGAESNTASFLKKYQCETLEDLKGKPIVVTFEVKKGRDTLVF